MSLRVLTVGNLYPPHHLGGYELVWQSAVRHLRRAGHEVRVLTTTHRRSDRGARFEEDPEVARDLEWYWRDDDWPRIGLRERVALERRNAAILDRHLADLAPDVVCWWAMGGMSLSLIERSRAAGIPEAFVICDDWLIYGPQVDAWQRFMGGLGPLRSLLQAVAHVPGRLDKQRRGPALFPSRTLARRAEREGWAFKSTEICHQGVPRELFRPSPPTAWRWQLAYVGRLDPRKGVDLALRALTNLPGDARLKIVGGGDPKYRTELERLAEELSLQDRVIFEELPRSDLARVYAASDAVLFPVRWEEPWGLVPLEAMATGTPVIATARGGSGEYLDNGENCLVFDPDVDGSHALASAVMRLANDANLRARLREGGLATVGRFSDHDFDVAVECMVRSTAL
jgi:glycogen synthase